MVKELTPYEFVNYLISNDSIEEVYNNGTNNILFANYKNYNYNDETPMYYIFHHQISLNGGIYYKKEIIIKLYNKHLRREKILKLKKKCH